MPRICALALIARLQELFVRGGVALYLAGHDRLLTYVLLADEGIDYVHTLRK